MSRSLKSFAHLLRGEICWSSPLPEQVTSSTGMAVSSISGFALRSICTRLVILWWTHFFLLCHFLFSPLPLNKRKGHSSSRSSENKRPFGFSLCYWIKNIASIQIYFLIPGADNTQSPHGTRKQYWCQIAPDSSRKQINWPPLSQFISIVLWSKSYFFTF